MSGIAAAAARRVRLLGLDVDGVWADTGVYLGPVAGERFARLSSCYSGLGVSGPRFWSATSRSGRPVSPDDAGLTELGRRVLQLEGSAVLAVATRLDHRFARAVRLVAGARGRVIVSGV